MQIGWLWFSAMLCRRPRLRRQFRGRGVEPGSAPMAWSHLHRRGNRL